MRRNGGCWCTLLLSAGALFLLAAPGCPQDRLLPRASLRPQVSGGLAIVHLLDVKVEGQLLFTAGYGGLSIYDIADLDAPRQLSNLNPFRSATETFYWRMAVRADHVYLTRRQGGLDIVDAADPCIPRVVGNYRHEAVEGYESVAVAGDTLYLAAYGQGCEVVDISVPDQPRHLGFVPGLRVFAAAPLGKTLLVADIEGGLLVYDVTDVSAPRLVGRDSTAAGAQFVEVSGDLAFLAMGSAGVRIYNLDEPQNPRLIAHHPTLGPCFHLCADGSSIYLAEGMHCEVLDIQDPWHPVRMGREPAQGWISGVAARGPWVFLADWETVNVLERRTGLEPDLLLSPSFLCFGQYQPGTTEFGFLRFRNVGNAPLSVWGILAPGSVLPPEPHSFTLDCDQETTLVVPFEPGEGAPAPVLDSLWVRSNDADEPALAVPVIAGTRDFGPGDPAPDFSLAEATTGETVRLSDFRGRPVLITFFAGW